jgi:chromosome segregation ATPase
MGKCSIDNGRLIMKAGKMRLLVAVFLFTMLFAGMPWIYPAQSVDANSGAATGEASFEEVREEMRELGQALGRYGAEQRDRALERARPALEDLDRRLDALEKSIEENWDEMSQAARERSRRAMRELRRQRVELAEKYGALKSSSAGAWEQMREGFLDAFSVLNEAWEKSIEDFRERGDAQDEVTL